MAQTLLQPQGRATALDTLANSTGGLPTSEEPKSRSVSAQELQARIKAARKKKTTFLSPPTLALLNPRQPRETNDALLRPNVTSSEQYRPSVGEYTKSHAVVEQVLPAETRQPNSRTRHGQSVPISHMSQPHGGVLINESPSFHRPQANRTASSRSSMIARKSPLSTVSLPQDSSSSNETLYSKPNKVMSSPIAYERSTEQRNSTVGSVAPLPPQPRSKSRLSWLGLTRRSHVSAV